MSVVAEARSGDLEIELPGGTVRPIAEAEVIDSFHRNNRYWQHRLLQIFLAENAPVVTLPVEFPPESDFREFVLHKLSMWTRAGVIEVTNSFLASRPEPGLDLETCLPIAKQIVLRMHNEELVSAKPWENDLFLTIGNKA